MTIVPDAESLMGADHVFMAVGVRHVHGNGAGVGIRVGVAVGLGVRVEVGGQVTLCCGMVETWLLLEHTYMPNSAPSIWPRTSI